MVQHRFVVVIAICDGKDCKEQLDDHAENYTFRKWRRKIRDSGWYAPGEFSTLCYCPECTGAYRKKHDKKKGRPLKKNLQENA